MILSQANRVIAYLAAGAFIVLAGHLAGRALRPGTSTFDRELWPTRGSGHVLIEFFDPACGASRAAHREIELVEQHAQVEHVLVPVSLGATTSFATPGALLCQLSSHDAFAAATDASSNGPQVVAHYQDQVRTASECARLNQVNLEYIATMNGTGSPSTPFVLLDGVPYHGLASMRLLSQLLAR